MSRAGLTAPQCRWLLHIARQAIKNELKGTTTPEAAPPDPALLEVAAVFVTLQLAGKLRGCIGNLEPAGPLWQGVRDNAVNAAFHDGRFAPLNVAEFERIRLEISILTPPQLLSYRSPEELVTLLRPGVDGVILRAGRSGATFLPQVWQQLPEPVQFLSQLCRKAGLAEDAWREIDPQILIYQVQSCHEECP